MAAKKDSIAGVIVDVTAEYAVPLFPAKGFSSLGFLYPSARGLEHAANGRPAHVLYVGDWDPGGKVIPSTSRPTGPSCIPAARPCRLGPRCPAA